MMDEKYVHSFLSNLPSIIFLLLIIQKNYSLIIGLLLVVTLVHTIKKLSNNIPKDNILYKCGWSPLEGTTFHSKVLKTFVNGNLVYNNGEFNETYRGVAIDFNQRAY